MKNLLLVFVIVVTSSMSAIAEEPIFSGRVESVYFTNYSDRTQGYTRMPKGLSGATTDVNMDVWVHIYQRWIVIELKPRKIKTAIPRERVIAVNIGNDATNALYPVKNPKP